MKRKDRLAALEAELRAVAPNPCTAPRLAERFGVSVRTIERDLVELQRSGVPIWARPGPLGGYTVDAGDTLPEIGLTLTEAAALGLALGLRSSLPYARAARSARAKLVAALDASAVEGARDLGVSLALLPSPDPIPSAVTRIIEQAVLEREVLSISSDGHDAEVEVEPLALAGGAPDWYLVGWCPTEERERAFRLDDISAVRPTGRHRGPGLPLTGERFAALVRSPESHATRA